MIASAATDRQRSLSTLAFWRAYWVTTRPYLFYVSGVSGLVGLALPSAMPRLVLAIAFFAFFFSYGLGQALTDVTQLDTDALSSPYRPLVRGEITRRQVLGVSLTGLALCGVTFWFINPLTIALSCVGVVGLATYTPLKRRWWGGPLWNSWIVALLPVIGALSGGRSFVGLGGDTSVLCAAASVFFSYAVFVILGYFKDVEADRATGYVTLPVRFGRKASVMVSALFLAAASISSVLLVARAIPSGSGLELTPWLGVALLVAGAAWLVLAHWRILPTTTDADAHPAIACTVRGFVTLHVGEAVLLRHDLLLPGLALLALFELSLASRPCARQI